MLKKTVRMNFVIIQKSMESYVKVRIWQKEADTHRYPSASHVLPVSDLPRFDGESESGQAGPGLGMKGARYPAPSVMPPLV